jgi:hypothetical protein
MPSVSEEDCQTVPSLVPGWVTTTWPLVASQAQVVSEHVVPWVLEWAVVRTLAVAVATRPRRIEDFMMVKMV